MNLRCIYCQTPFTLGRMEKLAAIQRLQAEEMHHYDVFCPRCRKANTVSIERLQIFTPGWKEGLKTLETEAAQAEKSRAAVASVAAAVKSAPPASAKSAPGKKRHASKAAKPAAAKPAKPKKAAPAKKSAAKPAKKTANKATTSKSKTKKKK